MRPHVPFSDPPLSSQYVQNQHISTTSPDSDILSPAGPDKAPPPSANGCDVNATLSISTSSPPTVPRYGEKASWSTSNHRRLDESRVSQDRAIAQSLNSTVTKKPNVLPTPKPQPNSKPTPTWTIASTLSKPSFARSTHSQKAAPPTRTFFDPWNSSSTGHQRAENRLSGSTSWRDSRKLKLSSQFRAGQSGGKRLADTVGAGSEDFGKDGRKENGGRERGASGLRKGGQKSLVEVWGMSKGGAKEGGKGFGEVRTRSEDKDEEMDLEMDEASVSEAEPQPLSAEKQIFRGLTFYINGSTAPLVSDHKLKRLIAERGGRMSIALGRRSVTHVILGPTASQGGAGGGLAGSKIQKEITRVGGKGVKFVGVDWILENIKAEKRLPEARFETLRLAGKGQGSVYGLFKAGGQ